MRYLLLVTMLSLILSGCGESSQNTEPSLEPNSGIDTDGIDLHGLDTLNTEDPSEDPTNDPKDTDSEEELLVPEMEDPTGPPVVDEAVCSLEEPCDDPAEDVVPE